MVDYLGRRGSQLSAIRALVVDEHRQMRGVIRSVLRAAGIQQTYDAEDIERARALLALEAYDLVLVDRRLGAHGADFVREIRFSETVARPDAAIILMSSDTRRHVVQEARDAGVNALLRKPVSSRTLLDRVGAALSDTRPYVRSDAYRGPERRRARPGPYSGPYRRATDLRDELMLDDGPQGRKWR